MTQDSHDEKRRKHMAAMDDKKEQAMTAPELKPCPFCGEVPTQLNAGGSYVYCHGCNAEGPYRAVDAIAAWNTRAVDVDHAAIREAALREAAAICIDVSNDVWTQIGREHERWMKATAEDCSKMILALIGEPK